VTSEGDLTINDAVRVYGDASLDAGVLNGGKYGDLVINGPIYGSHTTTDDLKIWANGDVTIDGAIGASLLDVSQTNADGTSLNSGATFKEGLYDNVPVLSIDNPDNSLTSGTAIDPEGEGATARVEIDAAGVVTVTLLDKGTGYQVDDVLKISGATLGGSDDLWLRVTEIGSLDSLMVGDKANNVVVQGDVTFTGPITIDGDLTIIADGHVTFGDDV